MVSKGFSTKEWRRVLGETEEEDAEQILQSLINLKINQQKCGWDVFIEEILPRLPANRLQKLKIVCKNWERVISSPDFVRIHLNRFNQNRIRVLVPRNSWMMIEYNNCDQQIKQIRHPPEIGQRRSKILGSCDGLVCLRLEGLCRSRKIAMYNPSTGKFFWVKLRPEDDDFGTNCSWFGHHPCSGEYILVFGSFDYEIGVYKFNRRSSLEKIQFDPNPRKGTLFFGQEWGVGTLLHGALHWPVDKQWTIRCGDYRHAISAYHLKNNKYLDISFPSVPVHSDFKLGVVDGCLFAFFCSERVGESKFQLWIMKEYGNPQSWIKYADIHGSISNYGRQLSPLGFFPNGNLNLYPNKLRLIDYIFNDDKVLLLHDDPYTGYEAIVCADSLVSPKIVGT